MYILQAGIQTSSIVCVDEKSNQVSEHCPPEQKPNPTVTRRCRKLTDCRFRLVSVFFISFYATITTFNTKRFVLCTVYIGKGGIRKWYLIVSIPDLCTITYFYTMVIMVVHQAKADARYRRTYRGIGII